MNKWKDRRNYLNDVKVLKEALDEYENWLRHYGLNQVEQLLNKTFDLAKKLEKI